VRFEILAQVEFARVGAEQVFDLLFKAGRVSDDVL
jgi:hypothetical protein